MKVVVIGATGFIGRALVDALVSRGDTVVALTRDPGRARQSLPAGVEAVAWTPGEPGAWSRTIDGADAVVNLTGEPVATRPWTADEKREILSSRLKSTRSIVEAIGAASAKPSVLVNGSAIGYYGSRGDEDLTEESAPGDDFLAGVVVQWEQAAREVEPLGVRLVLLRTAIVLGSGGGVGFGISRHGPVIKSRNGSLPQMALAFRLFGGGTMGYPGQWVSWIHIADEVGIVLAAIDDPRYSGPVNATAPEPVTMKSFSRAIGRALHRPSWVPFLGTILSIVLGQRREFLLASQRVLPRKAEQAGYVFRFPRVEEALQDLLG